MSDSPREQARTEDLAGAIAGLLPAIEEQRAAGGPDRAAEVSRWRPALDALGERLPRVGAGADAVLVALREVVIRAGPRVGAPGFLGWIAGGPAVVPAAAQVAAEAGAAQRWWVGPGNVLERRALSWLAELIGWPVGGAAPAGALVSGGAVANLIALSAARQAAGEARGIDVAADGVAGLREPRLYAAEGAHQVIERAAAVLGLGRRALVRLPPGRRGATLDVATLDRALGEDRAAGRTPVAIVATAGDAGTGAVDPLPALADLAAAHRVWLHIDGAYGALGVLDPRVASTFGDALDRADSLVLDPHKWLAVPVGCGAVLVADRRAGALEGALSLGRAPYIEVARREGGDPTSAFDHMGEGRPDHTIEHSAPARGVAVWAALAEIGADGVRARVARHLDCARHAAARARAAAPALEVLAEPVLSVLCLRYRPPGVRASGEIERANRALLRAVRARGRVIPSSTRVGGKFALRACFLGPRTTLADADALIDELLAAARTLTA